MLKTNSKEVKEKIRSFINEIFDASSHDQEHLNHADLDIKIIFIARTCWKEKGFEVIKKRMTLQEMFFDWCQGLPSVIDTAFYYCHHSAIDLLRDILEQTKEERAKYSECEAENMLTYLIYKEIDRALWNASYSEQQKTAFGW